MTELIIADNVREQEFIRRLKERAQSGARDAEEVAAKIMNDVKLRGDDALVRYIKLYDNAEGLATLSKADMRKGYERCSPVTKRALAAAAENIRAFHKRQIPSGYEISGDGYVLGQSVRGLSRVGLYVPGGSASYPSTVLMNAIPAKLAGVGELIIATPPGMLKDEILAAAHIAGADSILLMGGAHAVAALCYGTMTVPRVDKIVGPGNVYVAAAKKLAYGICDIDMIAGPSEILVIADSGANPDYIAADMLSQAEHDSRASAILVTDSQEVAYAALESLKKQCAALDRRDAAASALREYGGIIVCKNLDDCVDIAEEIAPEHLEIMTADPFEILPRIKNAGSVFLGAYSPEPLGDYYAGTNHVLPTSGTARFASPLSVDSFIKKTQYVYYSRQKLEAAAEDIIAIAECEGLSAHANSVAVRLSAGGQEND